MKLTDFKKSEQEYIKKGMSTAEITDKEATKKILDLVPEEWIKKIPLPVRGHATTKSVAKIAKSHPDLYEIAKKPGELPEKEREELKKLITDLFRERMNRHKIK